MSKLTYQQHGNQSFRIPVNQRRTAGGKALEDNRAAFAAKQLKQGEAVQRVEDEEERLKKKSGTAQRAKDGDEETAQTKFSDQAPPVQREKQPAKPNNTGLPDNLKNGVEALSGLSMDNVKVYYNSAKPQQLDALAYAQGTDIHVGPGQEKHLPHEAWHVVQQAQGRVKPTMQMKRDVPVNNDKGLEREADVMGAKAASVRVAQGKPIKSELINSKSNAPFQCATTTYSKTVNKPPGFTISPWPAVLSSGGADANSDIAKKVNDTLKDMGWPKALMSAHMIPKRLGGAGNNSNVRPWPTTFEDGDWKQNVEDKFDSEIASKNDGDPITYTVITDDLDASEATQVLANAEYKTTDPGYATHLARLQKIPKQVEAKIDGTTTLKSDKTWPIR